MFGLTKLLNALTTLADNLSALSATVAEVNTRLRHRLALDGAEEAPLIGGRPGAWTMPRQPPSAAAAGRRPSRRRVRGTGERLTSPRWCSARAPPGGVLFRPG
jgi:hypothetical protein